MSLKENNILRSALKYSKRGMDKLAAFLPDDIYRITAKCLLSEGPGHVLITTGFNVDEAAETDGPPGAYALCAALRYAGRIPVVVTGSICRGFFEGTGFQVEYVEKDPSPENLKALLDKYDPKALISVECIGQDTSGKMLNVRGEDVSGKALKFEKLFELASERGIFTIGIGDGGNEIGMGCLADEISSELSRTPCRVETDSLIIATTSNWGAYGLASTIGYLPSADELQAFTEKIVSLGAVDGIKRVPAAGVDGFSPEIDREIIEELSLEE